MDTRVAILAIVVEERDKAEELNHVLHAYGKYIIGRMGIPYEKRGISLISVAVDAPQDVISAMSGKIGNIEGVTAKSRLFQIAVSDAWIIAKRKEKRREMPMALAMQDVKALIDKLDKENALSLDEWEELIRGRCDQVAEYAAEIARQRSKEIFGNRIYTRGLIEISNYCKNNCYYCGIRRDNRQVERYRLSREDILSCADIGEELGFRTFVLQGEKMLTIRIRSCAI